MSIYHYDQPAAIQAFRENTGKQATMAGVTVGRFTCKRCGKSKPLRGRKRLTSNRKDGYCCADCAGGVS